MGRPVTLPPTKGVGIDLSLDVLAAIDDAVKERGINKRTLYEIALRRELGLPDYPGAPKAEQRELPLAG
jgi:hypothetical protein